MWFLCFLREEIHHSFTGWRVSGICLGIKANLEMFYLVDETYKHRNDHITITFGKPIPYTTFDHTKTPMQWAKWVKEQVYALGGITRVPV